MRRMLGTAIFHARWCAPALVGGWYTGMGLQREDWHALMIGVSVLVVGLTLNLAISALTDRREVKHREGRRVAP